MKRLLKAIGLFMVVILLIGVVSSLFNVDSDEPTVPGTTEPRPSVPGTDEPSGSEEPSEPEGPDVSDEPIEPEESKNTYDKDSRPVRLPSY